MRLIFEIRDLKYATPATVSRAGILFIPEARQWASYVQTWVIKNFSDAEHREILSQLFEKYVPDTLSMMRRDFKPVIALVELCMVQSLCTLLQGILTPQALRDASEGIGRMIECIFVYCAVWAFGGGLLLKDGVDYRRNFSSWWKNKWLSVKFPTKGMVYDFFIEKATLRFTSWSSIVPTLEYGPDTSMQRTTVPTPETTALNSLLDLFIIRRHPAMLVGVAGTGKTALIQGKLRALDADFLSLVINFNYYTDAASLQKILEAPLEKKAGKNYGPTGTKRLVYFVDDLNLPRLDAYNTQTPISLMRQHIDSGGWYDRQKLTIKVINNTQYLSSMNPSAGSFAVDPRLQRHFGTLAVGFPSQESLLEIFSFFLTGHLSTFNSEIHEMSSKIIQVRT
jgi:dynein heavy chain